MQAVSLHRVVLVTMGKLSQFHEGLATLGVSDALKQHPEMLHSYFCNKYSVKLSSGMSQ